MTIEELKELFFGRGQCDSYNKTKKPITKLKWILKQAEKEKIQFAIEVLNELNQKLLSFIVLWLIRITIDYCIGLSL